MARPRRRVLAKITPEDDTTAGWSEAGRPVLFGYGYGHLLRIGLIRRRSTISTAIARGIELHIPAVAIAWGFARRGNAEAARTTLRDFGFASRYRVSHRTLVRTDRPKCAPSGT